MLFALGLFALIAAIAGVAVTAMIAARQSTDDAPPSEPTDFVSPVSSGGFVWRGTDETSEAFKERIARANEGPSRK